jgi:hypothetical protein
MPRVVRAPQFGVQGDPVRAAGAPPWMRSTRARNAGAQTRQGARSNYNSQSPGADVTPQPVARHGRDANGKSNDHAVSASLR